MPAPPFWSDPGFPNFEQQKLLVGEGLGQTFWDSLTVTGIIEARGQGLCSYQAPDLQTPGS